MKKEVNNKEEQLSKELETIDNIITRHTNKENKQFNFGTALLELEKELKQAQLAISDRDRVMGLQEARVRKLEDAMTFFSEDWSKRFGNSIILPTDSEIKEFKK